MFGLINFPKVRAEVSADDQAIFFAFYVSKNLLDVPYFPVPGPCIRAIE